MKKPAPTPDEGTDEENNLKPSPVVRKKPSNIAGPASGIQKKSFPPSFLAKVGFLDKTFQFLREVRAELRKVAWPSRKQTMGSTIVVIILVIIISFYLGLVDIGLAFMLRMVLG